MAGSVGSFGSLDGVAEALAAIPRGSSDPQSSSASSASSSSSSLSSSSSSGLDAWLVAIRAESGSPAAGATHPNDSGAAAASSSSVAASSRVEAGRYLKIIKNDNGLCIKVNCSKEDLPAGVLVYANAQIREWAQRIVAETSYGSEAFWPSLDFDYSNTFLPEGGSQFIITVFSADSRRVEKDRATAKLAVGEGKYEDPWARKYERLLNAELFKIFCSGGGAGAASQPAKPGGLLDRARTLSKGTLRAPTPIAPKE